MLKLIHFPVLVETEVKESLINNWDKEGMYHGNCFMALEYNGGFYWDIFSNPVKPIFRPIDHSLT